MKFEGTDLIWYLLLYLWHLSGNFWVGINKRCSEQPWNFWGLESVHSKKSSTDKQVEWEQTLSRDWKKPPPTVCPSCIISHFIPSGAFSDPQDSAFVTVCLAQHCWGGRDSLSRPDLWTAQRRTQTWYQCSRTNGSPRFLVWGFLCWFLSSLGCLLELESFSCPEEDCRKWFCRRESGKTKYLYQIGKHYVDETCIEVSYLSIWNQRLKKFVTGDMKL